MTLHPKTQRLLVVLFVLLITPACAVGAGRGDVADVEPTTIPVEATTFLEQPVDIPPPTAEPPPPAEDDPPADDVADPPSLDIGHGELLYETDFMTGWPKQEEEGFGAMEPKSNGYEFYVTLQGLWMNSTKLQESFFYAEIEAIATQCPVGQAWYGMIFHYRDNEHFRFFVVTCSGKYFIFEREGVGLAYEIGGGNLPAGSDPGTGLHTLGIRSAENVLTLYYDSTELSTVKVAGMPAGDFGPYVETTGAPITVYFTRMAIFAP